MMLRAASACVKNVAHFYRARDPATKICLQFTFTKTFHLFFIKIAHMYRYLARLRSDLTDQLDHLHPIISPNAANMLNTLLTAIDPYEQNYLANHFKCDEWNVGSPIVLRILQRANILSMSEYLLHKMSDEAAHIDAYSTGGELPTSQLILNDLLESTEHQLLANVVQKSLLLTADGDATGQQHSFSIRLTDAIEECLRRLFVDLQANPNVISCNYLQTLDKHHLTTAHMRSFRSMHLRVLLELLPSPPPTTSTVADAFKQRHTWDEEFLAATAEQTMFKDILTKLFADPDDTAILLNQLFETVERVEFSGWKWYLHCLQMVQRQRHDDGSATIIRTFLRQLFKRCVDATTNDLQKDGLFMLMLMTARQSFGVKVAAAEVGRRGERRRFDYAQWYKETVGEMQYRQKVDEFRTIMAMLTRAIGCDYDVCALEVHSGCAISAPAHCNELVHSYRQMCKARLIELKSGVGAAAAATSDNDSDIEFV